MSIKDSLKKNWKIITTVSSLVFLGIILFFIFYPFSNESKKVQAIKSLDSTNIIPKFLTSDDNGNLSLFDLDKHTTNNDFSAKSLKSLSSITASGNAEISGNANISGKINSIYVGGGISTISDRGGYEPLKTPKDFVNFVKAQINNSDTNLGTVGNSPYYKYTCLIDKNKLDKFPYGLNGQYPIIETTIINKQNPLRVELTDISGYNKYIRLSEYSGGNDGYFGDKWKTEWIQIQGDAIDLTNSKNVWRISSSTGQLRIHTLNNPSTFNTDPGINYENLVVENDGRLWNKYDGYLNDTFVKKSNLKITSGNSESKWNGYVISSNSEECPDINGNGICDTGRWNDYHVIDFR